MLDLRSLELRVSTGKLQSLATGYVYASSQYNALLADLSDIGGLYVAALNELMMSHDTDLAPYDPHLQLYKDYKIGEIASILDEQCTRL